MLAERILREGLQVGPPTAHRRTLRDHRHQEEILAQIRRMGVVGEDGVHLSEKFCRSIAVNLCYRVAEAEVLLVREVDKRRRL